MYEVEEDMEVKMRIAESLKVNGGGEVEALAETVIYSRRTSLNAHAGQEREIRTMLAYNHMTPQTKVVGTYTTWQNPGLECAKCVD